LIAGKGHEDYQIIGREVFHFDDKEVAEKRWPGDLSGPLDGPNINRQAANNAKAKNWFCWLRSMDGQRCNRGESGNVGGGSYVR
jgi:hypothetical protein